jgi:oligopeptidase B
VNRRLFLLTGVALAASPALAAVAPPRVPKQPSRINQLGRTRVDDYAWLKPANWKEVWRDTAVLDPKIRAWLETENRYSDAILAPTKPTREALLRQMKAWTAPDLETPPMIAGPHAYVTRFTPGAQYPQHLRRPADGGPEKLLLDEQARAAGHAFFRIVNPTPSSSARYFAWAEDVTGAEKYIIYIRDQLTSQVFEGPHDAFGTFAFSWDGEWLFWTWRDEHSRPARIYRRPTTGGPDILVYEEPDPAFLLTVTLTNSGRYFCIRSWNDVTSEVRLVNTGAPAEPPLLVAPREAGHLYSVEQHLDEFVILTNSGGAVDFKVMRAPLDAPQRANWREWIPEQRGRTVTDIRGFAGRLARLVRVEGNSTLLLRDTGQDLAVEFDEPAYVLGLAPSDYDGRVLRLTYESPKTPKTWIDVNIFSGLKTTVAAQPVPGLDRNRFEVRRLHAKASDGAEVPITVLCRKGQKLDGSAPLLLTGYGSYGADYEPGFSIPNLAMVERGWVWAATHVRGGSEKGRDWFEQARQLKKKISFTDFIACAEHLIGERYTARRRIVLHGFSAGGLLTGAALNLRPDLFGACIGQAPFVDMLNTMSDATHPLVPLTRPVWGDPLADPADYDYIASYSPYENVAAKAYPPVLATTAIGDDRVGFWEPAKWIAALRERSTSAAPMLLHTEMAGAHAGAGGRFDEMAQIARMYAFAIWSLSTHARH